MSTHLCVRSSFSLLNGTMSVSDLVRKSVELEFLSVALVEKNVMYSAVAFAKECRKAGLKPIYGVEVDVSDFDGSSVIMLARNYRGYQQCMQVSSLLNMSMEAISFAQLNDYLSDCFLLIPSVGGVFENISVENAEERLKALQDVLTVPFTYGLSYHESSYYQSKNNTMKQLLEKYDIRSVALSCVYYEKPEDEYIFRVLRAIGKGISINDKTLVSEPDRYFYSKKELAAIYTDEELAYSDWIADQCNVDIYEEKSDLPVFTTPDNVDSATYLTKLANKGLQKRFAFKPYPRAYSERLQYELGIINSMNFSDYFLIVYDVIRYARSRNIYVGPGRGSAAGSLVAYCLGIVHVDPIEYGLLFERFLNPERISMPDIDIDFPDNRRQEVIDYVANKYGFEHVAHICTFGTLAAKQSIRDVGRVLQVPISSIDKCNKTIPSAPNTTLLKTYHEVKAFRTLVDSDEKLQEVFKIALRIEGLPRHISTHAAGIVLSSVSLNKIVPITQIEADLVSTQYSMDTLEELGLIKIDFLGLRNLTIIDHIVETIRETDPEFDILKISLADRKTYALIANVDTVGVFQLESDGMKALIKKMRPHQFMDIADTIALFRPGPMQNIPLYLENRKHPEKVTYLHPDLKPICEGTYGVLIYQEQIMQVAQTIAGFSLAKADVLRKAMSKKNEKELLSLKQEFLDGCLKRGYTQDVAAAIFELIEKFANYGFNKSHSVAYALISYQMAYLKANHPLLFYTHLLSSVIGSERKSAEYLDECRRYHVKVLGPSVNHSDIVYKIEGHAIRFPLSAIKGFGKVGCAQLMQERQLNGPYKDFIDFVARINLVKVSKKNLESLIYAGALDEFKEGRLSMIASLEEALNYADLVKVDAQGSLSLRFDIVSRPLFHRVKEDRSILDDKEYEALGLTLSSHPVLSKRPFYPQAVLLTQVTSYSEKRISVLVKINKVKLHKTKRMEPMAFVTLSDESSQLDAVVFPRVFKEVENSLIRGKIVLIEGIFREDSFIVNQVSSLNDDFH